MKFLTSMTTIVHGLTVFAVRLVAAVLALKPVRAVAMLTSVFDDLLAGNAVLVWCTGRPTGCHMCYMLYRKGASKGPFG